MAAIAYVPIIKGKVNDVMAVGLLDNRTRLLIKPLFEALPVSEKRPSVDDHVFRFCDHIRKHVPLGDVFVDFYGLLPDLTTSDGMNATLAGYQLLRSMGRTVTPAYGFERNDDIWPQLGNISRGFGQGFCFRVSKTDLLDYTPDELWSLLVERSAEIQIKNNEIDILLDCRDLTPNDQGNFRELITSFIAENPKADQYRSIVVAGSAALKQVGDVEVDGTQDVDREELQLWASLSVDLPDAVRPIFSDYAVVHPDFSDQGPNKYMNAKIRYTTGNKIVYHRGHGLLHPVKDFEQYASLARRAKSDPRYLGRSASFGDKYLNDVAEGWIGPGSPGAWIKADVNHHVAYTAHQISRLQLQLANADSSQEIQKIVATA